MHQDRGEAEGTGSLGNAGRPTGILTLRVGRILGPFGPCVPTESGFQRGQKRVKNDFSKSNPTPFGVPVDVFLARFEACLGCFDRPLFLKSLRVQPFWDLKRAKSGAKLCPRTNQGAKTHGFLSILRPVWTLWTPCTSQSCFEGPRMNKGIPEEQRL